jgi:predicted secreted protein
MANQGISGYGSVVTFTDGTSTTTVAEVKDITWTPGGMTAIDISTMESVSKWRDFVAGMKDPGDLSITSNFEDANTTAMLSIVWTKGTWKVQVCDTTTTSPTNGSAFSAAGFLNPFGLNNPMDGPPVEQTFTVKLSGAVSFTAKT